MAPTTRSVSRARVNFFRFPAEVRVNIYEYLFGINPTATSPKHRIYWRRGPHRNPGRKWTDTAIFFVCKQTYQEASHELVKNSIVVVEITDVRYLLECPKTYNSIQYLEIRDTEHSSGRQFSIPPVGRSKAWTIEERFGLEHESILHLSLIATLVANAPTIQTLVIGFEVIRAYLNRDEALKPQGLPSLPSFITQAHDNLLISDLTPFRATGYGKWDAQSPRGANISILHINVASIVERASKRDCGCWGSGMLWRRIYNQAKAQGEEFAAIVHCRHRLAQWGLLGAEANWGCASNGGRYDERMPHEGLVARTRADWEMRTWSVLRFDMLDV